MLTKTSISFRLKLVYLGVVSFALLCHSVLNFSIIQSYQSQSLKKETLSLLNLISVNLIAPLSFGDSISAEETLTFLNTEENVISAYVFDKDNNLFAKYNKDDLGKYQSETFVAEGELSWNLNTDNHYSDNVFHYISPVNYEDEQIGSVYIRINLDFHKSEKATSVIVTVVIFVTAAFLVLLSFVFIRKWVISPLEKLSQLVGMVTKDKDYSLRLEYKYSDQIGKLMTGFNHMLEEIETRDNELQQWAESLEAKVIKRTKELSDSNLELEDTIKALQQTKVELSETERSKLEAETKEKAKSTFLANMSHELRTPMNGVLGIMSLLKDTGLTRLQDDLLEIGVNSANYLLAILNDILDYSKIESGKIEYETILFDPLAVVDEALQIVNKLAMNKKIKLYCFILGRMPESILGDQIRIKQIIINLLSNAIKFTEEGYVSISVRVIKHSSYIDLEFSVLDTGIGISNDKQTSIFESFQQADSSTTRLYGGTGLGLALSKLLAEGMGGRISLESELGNGSCFKLTVPFEVQGTGQVIHHEVNKVCIYDPDKFERVSMGLRCRSAGFSPLLIKDIDRLKRELDNNHVQTVLVDYYCVSELKDDFLELVNDPNVKVKWIFYGNHVDRKSCETLFDDVLFLTTPISQIKLCDILYCQTKVIDLNKKKEEDEHKQINEKILALKTGNFKVLVVDDNEVNLMVAVNHLKKLGLEVYQAKNGLECLNFIIEHPVDLILMDCQMPVMDGYEACKNIKSHEDARVSATNIVAMTSNAFEKDREKCLQVGMVDYMTKPIDRNILVKMLYKWLANTGHNSRSMGH